MDRKELLRMARELHDEKGCGCDPEYIMSCPNMANAILASGTILSTGAGKPVIVKETTHLLASVTMGPDEVKEMYVKAVGMATENPGTKVVLNFPPGIYKADPADIPHIKLSQEEGNLYIVTGKLGGSVEIFRGETRIVMTFNDIAMTCDPELEEIKNEGRWGI
jgi:hypothetical protein